MSGIVNFAITGLSGIPSILFGLVGYTLLIYGFGISRSLLCASLCVSAMIVPFVAIRARKVFEEKGISYMTNSIGLGLSREYALRKMILPVCFPELLGTVALGMAYGMGAVAPILYTGAVMQAGVPSKLTDPFMSLPLIYFGKQRILSGLCLRHSICTDAFTIDHSTDLQICYLHEKGKLIC